MDKMKVAGLGFLGGGAIVGVIALAVIGMILVGIVLVAAYFGFVPILSDLMGTNKPMDLGVTYSNADYMSGLQKIPGHSVTNPEYMCITCPITSTGSVPTDNMFTQEEFTAQMNKVNSEKGPLKDIQVKFNQDGTIEASMQVIEEILNAPVYVKGKIESYGERFVSFDLEDAMIGRLPIGGEQLEIGEDLLNQGVQYFIAQTPGLKIQELSIGEGFVDFEGMFPEHMEGDPYAEPMQLIQN